MIFPTILYFLFVAMNSNEAQNPMTNFKSERIQQSASFILNKNIEEVFPLFGPVREKDWAAGWEPSIVYPPSNKVEKSMVFQTKGRYPGEEKYTWIISEFDRKNFTIEYTVSTADRIWLIKVVCKPKDIKTEATVSYMYTGLSVVGNERNKESLKKMFANNLKDWQDAINYYLETGKQKQ
jgi:hypothetical protein